MRHLVGHTKNGVAVYIDLINSQAAPHIAAHPHLLGLASQALGQITAKGPRLKVEHNLQRAIGYENVVKTPAGEKVLYARLVNDELYSRFTRKGEPQTTTYVSLTLEREASGSYELVDTWIGRLKPPRPGSVNETAASREYWENHAFLLDTQAMQRQTRTETCPY
jgi:hypothetical protein